MKWGCAPLAPLPERAPWATPALLSLRVRGGPGATLPALVPVLPPGFSLPTPLSLCKETLLSRRVWASAFPSLWTLVPHAHHLRGVHNSS